MKEKQKSEIWGTKQKVYKARSGARGNGQREGRKKKLHSQNLGCEPVHRSVLSSAVSYAAIINANIRK